MAKHSRLWSHDIECDLLWVNIYFYGGDVQYGIRTFITIKVIRFHVLNGEILKSET